VKRWKPSNRVAEGILPSATTTPCMRTRAGRFPKMFRVGRPITSHVTPMMASNFAPTPLSTVGYEAIELHRFLIDFQIHAFA